MGGCAVRSWVIWRCGEDDRKVLLRMLSVVFSVRLVTLPTNDALWVGVMGSSHSTRGRLKGLCGRDRSMGHGHESLRRRRLDGARVQQGGFSVAFGVCRVAQPCIDVLCGGENGGEQRPDTLHVEPCMRYAVWLSYWGEGLHSPSRLVLAETVPLSWVFHSVVDDVNAIWKFSTMER